MSKPAKVIGWSVAVVSGLVAIAAWLGVGPQELSAYGTKAAAAVWGAVVGGLTFGVPVWLILAVVGAGVVVLWLLSRGQPEPSGLRLPPPADPTEAYFADSMFGVEWVWRWSFTGPDAITALCPSCKNELGQPHNGEFACSNCHRQYRTDLAHSYMADHGQEIEKEIRRRCRTGEWKGAPQRLKKPETRAAGH